MESFQVRKVGKGGERDPAEKDAQLKVILSLAAEKKRAAFDAIDVMEDHAELRSKAGKVAERTKTMQEHQENAGKRHMGTRSQFEGVKVEK